MAGTGEDRALDMLESALDVFNAHGRSMTPAEQAIFSACLAQALAAIDTRDAVRRLASVLVPEGEDQRDALGDFTTAATALAAQLERYNDSHGF